MQTQVLKDACEILRIAARALERQVPLGYQTNRARRAGEPMPFSEDQLHDAINFASYSLLPQPARICAISLTMRPGGIGAQSRYSTPAELREVAARAIAENFATPISFENTNPHPKG